ncbi:hypothetical protein SAMN06298212_11935 [Ruaniaceae bacterium KH17]|nr:hypothetical protein SAMN06298212_11935 [Ruaniaceae bacterium KH17]
MSEHIGVLLPVQLETVFTDEGDGPLLMVRVIPQPPHIDEHSEFISDGELDAVSRFRQAVGRVGTLKAAWLDTRHLPAFDELVAATGGARAAWLAQHTTARRIDGVLTAEPLTALGEDLPSVVRGLPPRLKVGVWTYAPDGMEQLEVIGELPQDGAEILPGRLPDLRDEKSVLEHWIGSFALAQDAGLGGVFALPEGLEPSRIAGVTVFGLGDEDPAALMESQVAAGRLTELPLGTSTASVGGAATAPAQDWWATLMRRLDGSATSLDDLVERYLTGAAPPSLPRAAESEQLLREANPDRGVLGRIADELPIESVIDAWPEHARETGLAPLLLRALWPVLWGEHSRFAHADPQAGPDELEKLSARVAEFSEWALDYVNPEGPLPAVRIGEDPYAVLPLTQVNRLDPQHANLPDPVAQILEGLRLERQARFTSLVDVGTVRGADAERYASLLARGGSPRAFGYRARIALSVFPNVSSIYGWHDQEVERWGNRGLRAFETSDPLLTHPLDPSAIALPLVHPRHWAAFGLRGRWHRLPLPVLLTAIWDDQRLLRHEGSQNPWPPTSLWQLFSDNAPFIASTEGWDGGFTSEGWLRVVPESLLARLILQSALTLNRWEQDPYDPMRMLASERGTESTRTALLQLAVLLDPTAEDPWETFDEDRHGYLAPEVPRFTTAPTPGLVARLERALGATLDTVSGRIDPWLTGFAWQRLQEASARPDTHRRLGAYGWVQGPFLGVPGPTSSGLLHAPSQAQAQVATLALDSFHQGLTNEQGQPAWGMALTGSAIRTAKELVADVRDGHHIREVLGREVERIVGDFGGGPFSLYERLAWLRTEFPMHEERPDPRQTCDGEAALKALLDNPASAPFTITACRTALLDLSAGVEAMAKLNLLDGAVHLLNGNPDSAAASMDATANGAPPEPRFPETPTAARELSTTVLSVLPWREAQPGDAAATLADPSLAGYLADQLGTEWTWRFLPDGAGPPREVHLSELGLRPVDTLALSSAHLRGAAAAALGLRGAQHESGRFDASISEHENRYWEIVRRDVTAGTVRLAQLGIDPAVAAAMEPAALERKVLRTFFGSHIPVRTAVQPVSAEGAPRLWAVHSAMGAFLGAVDEDDLGLSEGERGAALDELAPRIRAAVAEPGGQIVDPPEHELAARLNTALGSPAAGKDLPLAIESPGSYADLRERYLAVHADLTATVKQLRAARRTSRVVELLAAIRRAAPWGVAPGATPEDEATFFAAVTGTVRPRGATTPKDLAGALADALEERLKASPKPTQLPSVTAIATRLKDYRKRQESGLPDGIDSLASALSTLAAPQGTLAILTRWERAELLQATGLDTQPNPAVNEDWLTMNASVRANIARVEALHLHGVALEAWSSSADPWQVEEISQQPEGRERDAQFAVPPLVTAFGPGGSLAAQRVAVGLVDAWREDVPTPHRVTFAAFGFNAPAAQAPRAILLAVPPHAGEELTVDDLPGLLAELRMSLVARTWRGPDPWLSSIRLPVTDGRSALADPAYQ